MCFQCLNVLGYCRLREIQCLGCLGVAANSAQNKKCLVPVVQHSDPLLSSKIIEV